MDIRLPELFIINRRTVTDPPMVCWSVDGTFVLVRISVPPFDEVRNNGCGKNLENGLLETSSMLII